MSGIDSDGGAREVVKKKKLKLGNHRKGRETIRSVATFR